MGISSFLRGRRARAGALALLGGTAAFLMMANHAQLPRGALWGGIAMLVCTVGILGVLGSFAPADASLPRLLDSWRGEGGVAGWFRRPGVIVVLGAVALYLPPLGAVGLWDPWETHYGEVAREILARDDWISLWWAQDGWFWSKPIFDFWSQALCWSASGIDFLPDTNFKHTEWVVRLPTFCIAVSALYSVYYAVRRRFSARAGVICALVLGTIPYFGLLARQSITDMPFVGLMTIAVMFLMCAVDEDPEREAPAWRLGRFTVSARELVLGVLVILALPQALYLASRNITFVDGLFAWHRDSFLHGSAFNADVPGNPGLYEAHPWAKALWLEPLAQGIAWAACLVALLWALRRERRAQALWMLAFYLACVLAFMSKGIPGFGLPGLVALLYLIGSGRWALLSQGRFRVGLGALVITTIGMPWPIAMYMRHGPGFTDRLLVHDHLNRLASGVHGDTGSIQYFLEQLGTGIFPWIAMAPLAFGAWLWRMDEPSDVQARRERELELVMGLWLAATFTLFSAMITKFHHYIFPAVPPAAVLMGLALDRMLGVGVPSARIKLSTILACLAPLPLVLGVAGLVGDVRGVIPAGLTMAERAVWALQHPWPPVLCVLLVAVGVAMLVAAALWWRGKQQPSAIAWGAGALSGAVLCAFVGRDLSWTTTQRPAGQERLVHLFIYNYDRPFPEYLDYRAIYTGFAVVATLLIGLCAIAALRAVSARALCGLALVFSVWLLDVYFIDLSPHWSQQQLVYRYYRLRAGPQEPLVAWQMNWKGENYYTGNRVAVFVDLNNKEIGKWIEKNRGKRIFALLEHSRLDRFRRLLGKRKVYELSTKRDNNKFILVKARL